jgi:hypothetical protein
MEHIKQIAGLRRLHVAVEVGQPLATDDYSSVEMKDVARQQVQELVNRARARLERTS